MKILLFALSLVALVGCAGRPTVQGLRFNSAGAMVNTGVDLNRVKLEGEMWTHGQRINIMPFKVSYWPAGEAIQPNWRMESVDRLTLYGRSDEGKLNLVFPDNKSAPAPDPTGFGGFPYCSTCGFNHLPKDPHGR